MATQHLSSSPAQLGGESKPLGQELSDIAQRATSFTKAAGALVFLQDGEHLVVVASTGPVAAPGHRTPMAGSFAGRAVQSARVVRCDDVDADGNIDVTPFLPLRARSLTAVPVGGVGGAATGALVVVSDAAGAFSRTHLAILQTMADVVAEKCKHDDPFAAVLRAEIEPRRLPQLEAELARLASARPAPTTTQEPAADILPVAAASAIPVVRPFKSSASVVPIAPAASRTKHITSTYETARFTAPAPRSSRPIWIAVLAITAVFVTGVAWSRYQHSNPALAASATTLPAAAAPSPQPAGAVPAASAPVQPFETASRIAEKPAPKPHHTIDAAPQPEPQPSEAEAEPQPQPPLRMPGTVPHATPNLALAAPQMALAAKHGPDLLAPTAALPLAPVSKVVPARLTRSVAPVFPPLLRKLGKTGSVSLRLHVSPKGEVDSVTMLSGDSNFRSAAETAVRQWRYEPALLDGKPIDSNLDVVLHFNLPRN